ncbi:MAG TPA: hypothetical protein VN539_00100 [Candidatus Saccharimonadales bacterium]|nr:hypothetical protein [Candidatus Saccharimonadales bacterium]
MLGFLVRLLMMLFVVRFLGGVMRLLGGGGRPPESTRVEAERPPKPLVDRASAIDVPFTEEPRES